MRRTTTSVFDDESAVVVVVQILLSVVALGVNGDDYPCGSWKKDLSVTSGFAMREPYINTEYGCKMTCMGISQCSAIGLYYKKGDKVECYQTLSSVALGMKMHNFTALVVWRFSRKAVCQVHCMYGFTVISGVESKKGEEVQSGIVAVHACKVACMNRNGCIGFNWWEKDKNNRPCRLITETGPLSDESVAAFYAYGRAYCSGLFVSAKMNSLMLFAIGSWCLPVFLLVYFLVSAASGSKNLAELTAVTGTEKTKR